MTRENPISPRCNDILRRLWPNTAGQLLLNAALLADNRAVESWQRLYRQMGLEFAEDGEFQLLPLVYANLRDLGYTGPETAKLHGAYRKAWYCNQLLFHATAGAAAQLAMSGIPSRMIRMTGGLVTIARFYPAHRLRTVRQGELLVDASQLKAAVESLADGWQPRQVRPNFPSKSDQHFGYYASFQRSNAAQPDPYEKGIQERTGQMLDLRFDLHWKLFDPRTAVENSKGGSQKAPFPAGIPYGTQEGSLLTLDPATSLLAACLQAFPHHWSSLPWVADAFMILQAAPSLEWQSVIGQAVRYGAALPTLAALTYLSQCYSAPIPPTVLETLANTASTPEAEAALDCLMMPPDQRTLAQRLQMGLRVYASGNPDPSWLSHLTRFPAFLRYYWSPGRVLRRIGRQLAGAFT
jgi:Uncharacterised nucleotidyltransferase